MMKKIFVWNIEHFHNLNMLHLVLMLAILVSNFNTFICCEAI